MARPLGSKNRFSKEVAQTIAAFAETHLPEHLERLHRIIMTAEKDKDAITALNLLWSRAWGRPSETVKLTVDSEQPLSITDLLRERSGEVST